MWRVAAVTVSMGGGKSRTRIAGLGKKSGESAIPFSVIALPPNDIIDLTGIFCTSESEREFSPERR